MANRIYEWVDERTGIKPAVDYVLYRRIPNSVNWLFTLGSATLTTFIVQAVTGIFLAMGYAPSTAPVTMTDGSTSNEALASINTVTADAFGFWVRNIHHWGASVMVAVIVLHTLRVFFLGSYKYPREINWFVGVFILLLTLGFAFTGYLLPWDNKAYWATQVGVKIGGSAPILGDAIQNILRGGPDLGAPTLTRFYALHVLLLPSLTAGLIGLHLFLLIKIGISGQPKYFNEELGGEFFDAKAGKKKGHAFFPYTIFQDAVISGVVFAIIIALAAIFPVDTKEALPANPAQAPAAPRPEWYFLFLFQFLKLGIFGGEYDLGLFKLSGEAIGAIVIPTVILVLLFLVPVLDRSRARSPFSPSRLPWTIGAVLIGLGIIALTLISVNEDSAKNTSSAAAPVPSASTSTGTTPAAGGAASGGTGDVQAGLAAFGAKGCVACHSNNGLAAGIGPKLVGVGVKGDQYITTRVRQGKGTMPAFGTDKVSDKDLADLIAYIKSLK